MALSYQERDVSNCAPILSLVGEFCLPVVMSLFDQKLIADGR
jgi:hypothetical protein